MVELKPYQLVQTYTEARHSRFNSWVFSVLAVTCTVSGVGFFANLDARPQLRYGGAIGCWLTALVLVNRGATASKQANLYGRRVAALELASEDSYVYNLMKSVQPGLPPIQLEAVLETSYYNWQNAIDEGVGFIIAGNSGAGKTSVATWLTGLLTQAEPSQCLVLDPHWNDLWSQQGLVAIGHIKQIEETVKALLAELDARCDRKGRGEPLGEPLLIIADEIGACLERFKNPKWIESALRRLGSEGRKFNMTLIAINQSQNVDDLGISGSLRNNYVLILLGAAARKYAQQMGKEYQDLLKGVPYPCVVSGAAEDTLAIHPTHGDYSIFKKKGNAPMNLLPIRQLPLVFLDDLQLEGEEVKALPRPTGEQFRSEFNSPVAEKVAQPVKQVNFELDDVLPELQPIVRLSMKQNGWIRAIDCKRNINALKTVSTEVIREYFIILANQGCGETSGEGEQAQYTAFEE